jgi:hypothetical protein
MPSSPPIPLNPPIPYRKLFKFDMTAYIKGLCGANSYSVLQQPVYVLQCSSGVCVTVCYSSLILIEIARAVYSSYIILRVYCTVVTLLLHCCHTVPTLLLHIYHTVVTLLLHCRCTVVTLLLHYYSTVVTLFQHCCCTYRWS